MGEGLRKFCADAGRCPVVDEIDIMNGGKDHDLLDRDAQFAWEANVT